MLKVAHKILFLMLVGLGLSLSSQAKTKLCIWSYNMLFEHHVPADSAQQWAQRLPNALASIKRYKPDIIGSQELQTYQVEQLASESGYGWAGLGISHGDRKHVKDENEAILYNKSRLDLLSSGMVWFSTTPSQAGSYSWGMKYPRACTWAKFKVRRTGQTLYVLNSHFYVDGDKEHARLEAAKLIMSQVHGAQVDASVILTGDFNATISSLSLQYMLRDGSISEARSLVSKPEGPAGSYHGFDRAHTPTRLIDHIFVTRDVKVKRYRVIDDQLLSGKWESDHLPVAVDIQF